VPTFASKGVEVPPQIEAVVRHALEKDPGYRTPSADEFANELNSAMASASAALKRTGDSPVIDPSKTIVTPSTTAVDTFGAKGSETAFDPLAGTISSQSLLEDDEKIRVAQEELAREAEARRRIADEKRLAQEDKQEAERRHLEEIVAKQTQVIEERLSQLAASMAPKATATIDPDATQVSTGAAATIGNNSFPGTAPQTFPHLEVGLSAPRKKSRLLLILVLGAVLVLGAGVGGFLLIRSRIVKPSAGPVIPKGPHTIKEDMILIPGGTFQMGRDNGPLQEGAAHPVTVNSFYMQRTEVTNAQYAEFIQDTRHEAPSHWFGGNPAFGQEQWAVINVSVGDANSFADWLSKRDGVKYRLPTEEEWEYAARNGDQDSLYPWGNEFQDDRAVLGEGLPRAVGSIPNGKNRWGVLDLIGNVWEWTSSEISLYPGSKGAVLSPKAQGWYVKRGGSYASDKSDKVNPITSTFRDFAPPSTKHPTIGFRLVRSP